MNFGSLNLVSKIDPGARELSQRMVHNDGKNFEIKTPGIGNGVLRNFSSSPVHGPTFKQNVLIPVNLIKGPDLKIKYFSYTAT